MKEWLGFDAIKKVAALKSLERDVRALVFFADFKTAAFPDLQKSALVNERRYLPPVEIIQTASGQTTATLH